MIATLIRRVVPARFRPIGYLTTLTQARTGSRVRQGPFASMRYVDNSIGSAYIPKLLGLYERELQHCIEAISLLAPELIINIGAGEGYYAVGLAICNSNSQIIAYELEPAGRCATAEMAELNNVAARVEIRGKCEPTNLIEDLAVSSRAVVVCDVEGYEAKLLDPQAIPALREATILVELHEFVIPGISAELRRRFAETHRIDHIWQEP